MSESKGDNKFKPTPFTIEEMSSQIAALERQKQDLTELNGQIQEQLRKVEFAVKDRDRLRQEVTRRMGEVTFRLFEEWKKKSEYYPDLRLQLIQKATESLDPPKRV